MTGSARTCGLTAEQQALQYLSSEDWLAKPRKHAEIPLGIVYDRLAVIYRALYVRTLEHTDSHAQLLELLAALHRLHCIEEVIDPASARAGYHLQEYQRLSKLIWPGYIVFGASHSPPQLRTDPAGQGSGTMTMSNVMMRMSDDRVDDSGLSTSIASVVTMLEITGLSTGAGNAVGYN